MQDLQEKRVSINALFDEPKPLDKLLAELIGILEITQHDLSEATGVTQASISRIVSRTTTKPAINTLEKIRFAVIEQYGADPERATMEFFLACRALLEPRPADTVDSRFAEIDEWLQTQPTIVQENFWSIVQAFKHSVDTSAK